MSMRCVTWVAILAGAALANPASARNMDALRGHAVLRDFAKCSVKREPALARAIALGRNGPGGMSDEEIVKALNPRCLGLWGVRFNASGLGLRGAFAEELIRREFGQPPLLDPIGLGPLNWPAPTAVRVGPGARTPRPVEIQRIVAAAARDARVGRLGECVLRASPAGAAAVLNAKMDSKAELAALRALTPYVARCVQAGHTSNFNGTNMRYALALSYYRFAVAARTMQTPKASS